MYLPTTSRANKDGSVVRYLGLAHNEKVAGTARAKVLLNLGREDQFDPDGLRRLVSSLARYLGDPDPYANPDADPVAGLTVTSSRQLGGVHLLDGLWHQLWVSTARCGNCSGSAGCPPMWNGCCSRSWRTGPWTPARSGPCVDFGGPRRRDHRGDGID